ncbi:hypothetical protein SASPL_125215 [Salvia splendens]|uniref:F-box domain-containing protein n=1 Tax=Salvia splendens TaxID=180675 RepID=A0A8X8XI44_SALSN|nr:hypothetical protein SASPL_125215 [Salvia splendens]
MESPKRCNHEDLLRELPDVLIFDIFWRLPMTDVVRTSVLSKRWRDFWTTAPFLNFDNRDMLFGEDSKLRNFINRALLCWNGNKVLKFSFWFAVVLPYYADQVFEPIESNSSKRSTCRKRHVIRLLHQVLLLRLRTIEVTWSEGYSIFPLIEILLKYASKLEKFVFQIKEIKSPAPSDSLLSVSQKLLRMRRSSSNCTVDLTILS